MRGEDWTSLLWRRRSTGSPPHARGRQVQQGSWREDTGITPACAGKTIGRSVFSTLRGDHPRMRGEDVRARCNRINHCRITPACAGKTPHWWTWHRRMSDHPRMRGEDVSHNVCEHCHDGSPPHARGRRMPIARRRKASGITPACAGKTHPNS